jgi:predicted nuclease with TOPRIM domain
MKKCDCEHWETCTICYPQGFDGQGNRKPVEVPPTREELQAKVTELQKAGIDICLKLTLCESKNTELAQELNSISDRLKTPFMHHHKMTEKEQGFADGWNALRKRLLEKAPTLGISRGQLRAQIAELTQERNKEQLIGDKLFAKLTRAESVIEKCNLALELNVPLLTTRLAAIFAISNYMEGK